MADMRGFDRDAGQGFRTELPTGEDGGQPQDTARKVLKVIATIAIIGVTLVALPFVFCLGGIVIATVTRSMAVGFIVATVLVIGVIYGASKLIGSLFKKD